MPDLDTNQAHGTQPADEDFLVDTREARLDDEYVATGPEHACRLGDGFACMSGDAEDPIHRDRIERVVSKIERVHVTVLNRAVDQAVGEGARARYKAHVARVIHSDEVLGEKAGDRDIYRVSYKIRQPLQKRLMANVETALERVDAAGWRRKFESRLPR